MAVTAPLPLPEQKQAWYWKIAGVALHTFLVYVIAVRLGPDLAKVWCLLVLPSLGLYNSIPPRDWHLQHLELLTVVPGLLGGYINLPRYIPVLVAGQIRGRSRRDTGAFWPWIVPTCILLIEIVQHRLPSSVLYASPPSQFSYFFEIQRHISTLNEVTRCITGDPRRLLSQITVTAPFYSGIAYTAGALLQRYKPFISSFGLRRAEMPVELDESDDDTSTPERPSSSAD